MEMRIILIIAFVLVLLFAVIFWISGRKHFCNYCGIAYVFSPTAWKKTHCDECGRPLTDMDLGFDDKGSEGDDQERNE